MPVRLLSSSVLKWPDVEAVERAVRDWAARAVRRREDVLRIGYFGSYARRNAGVGSDLDLVILLDDTSIPFERRAIQWSTSDLPVPADVLVYTRQEWEARVREVDFFRRLDRETIWVYVRGG